MDMLSIHPKINSIPKIHTSAGKSYSLQESTSSIRIIG